MPRVFRRDRAAGIAFYTTGYDKYNMKYDDDDTDVVFVHASLRGR